MTGSEALPGKVEAGNRGLSLLLALVAALLLAVSLCAPPVQAQDGAGGNLMETVVPSSATPELEAPGQVQVQPTAQDDEIRQRLEDILQATNWYVDPQVAVQEGVLFQEGRTGQEDYRTWAGDLARNTENVVAVVNRIQVIERSPWDFSLALDEVRSMIQDLVVSLPQIGFGLLVLLFTWLLE